MELMQNMVRLRVFVASTNRSSPGLRQHMPHASSQGEMQRAMRFMV